MSVTRLTLSAFLLLFCGAATSAIVVAEPPNQTRSHKAKETLTAVEMNRGETIKFELKNGDVRTLELIATSANVLFPIPAENKKGVFLYEMVGTVKIDSHILELRRYVGSQESFYEPYVINGMRVWFDGVADVEKFLTFDHGPAELNKDARFALQDATMRICPPELLPWYPNTTNFIDIADTYDGTDCWMGPYKGREAHGGLDILQPKGTVNFVPFAVDDQYLFNSLAKGDNNNRWEGVRSWPNGDNWLIRTNHLLSLLKPEHVPIEAGDAFSFAAGVHNGSFHHSHYNFAIQPKGSTQQILLDPWILFWQIFEDAKRRAREVKAAMEAPGSLRTGKPVLFIPTGSRPGAGRTKLQYQWTFADGGGSLAAKPSHVFAAPGVYPVTLTVDDGANLATTTQHVTVDGPSVNAPVLALDAPDETAWKLRPPDAQDVYGIAPRTVPRTLDFLARHTRPKPAAKEVKLINRGGGELAPANLSVEMIRGHGWLRAERVGHGNQQTLRLNVNATELVPALYKAHVTIEVPGALNSRQSFSVTLLVPGHPPGLKAILPDSRGITGLIIDNEHLDFSATAWFWIGHRVSFIPEKGRGGFYLLNGGRGRSDGFARFTPDLLSGSYEVRFDDATPFSSDARFAARVRHKDGDEIRWIEPSKSRVIGNFRFDEGTDGFVEILTSDSQGQICADAVIFAQLVHGANPTRRP